MGQERSEGTGSGVEDGVMLLLTSHHEAGIEQYSSPPIINHVAHCTCVQTEGQNEGQKHLELAKI